MQIGLFREPFCPTHTTSHLDSCNSLFFLHKGWFYTLNLFRSSWLCFFRLQIDVHRRAMLLAVFWRNKRVKRVSAEKWKSEEYRSYLFCVNMKLQFHNTWITLMKTVKCCKYFFLTLERQFTPLQNLSCACKFNLRLQSYVHFHKSYPTLAILYGINLPSYKGWIQLLYIPASSK